MHETHARDEFPAPRDTGLFWKSRGRSVLLGALMSTPSAPAEHAVIKTSYGEITVAFWPDVAPKTVENFKKLAREGFYNGTAFHRIIKGFMIQGGCPTRRPDRKVSREPVIRAGRSRPSSMPNRTCVAFSPWHARSHPDSAGSQFFICHGEARFLDRQYTGFGEVVKGLEVLDQIAGVPCSGSERSTPVERVALESVTIVPA